MALGNKEIMSENIKYYMQQKGKDRNDLVADLNLKYMTVSDWINGKTYPRIDKIELLADYFGIKKSDLVEQRQASSTTLQRIQKVVDQLEEPRKLNVLTYSEKQLDEQKKAKREVSEKVVPLYDVVTVSETAAASGFGRGFGYDDSDRETIQVDERPPRHDIATRVSGDSMEPDYHDGDILYLVDKGLTTYNGELAVIAYGDRSYFKKIYTENRQLRLVSLNDKYEDIILDFPPAEDTHIKIFAVVGRYGKER